MAPDALAVLEQYHWPGNIRELENVIERAIVLGSSEMIDVDTLPVPLRQPPDRQDVSLELPPEGLDLEATLDRIEQRYMQMALDRDGWRPDACRRAAPSQLPAVPLQASEVPAAA